MQKDSYHFIGIGGIGMSGLARILLQNQQQVYGSDLSQSSMALSLQDSGAKLFSEHASDNIKDPNTIVVYSTAISDSNPEIVRAKELGCRLWHRSRLLSELMQSKTTLAVTGTHGKTSTSALLAHTLISANRFPSYVVGGVLKNQGHTSSSGEGEHFVLEADESDGTFINYHPDGSIVTNLEEDHLGYFYKDLEEIETYFKKYFDQIKHPEYLFWCRDCPNLTKLAPRGFSYGFHLDSDVRICAYSQKEGRSKFSLDIQGKRYEEIELPLMGKQNALNASAIFGLCIQLGLQEEEIRQGFRSFEGVQRRSERLPSTQKIELYDDYAHHPTEIEVTLRAFRKAFGQRRVLAIFQPHRYSRLRHLKKEFTKCFKKASVVWLTDVYRAGEAPLEGFYEEDFAKEIEENSFVQTHYVPKDQLLDKLQKEAKPYDVIVTLGAGDITHTLREFSEKLLKKPTKMKVGVICGSRSLEHYISLISKEYFLKNLDPELFETTTFKIDVLGHWSVEGEYNSSSSALPSKIYSKLNDCDILFPILHGPWGEDGMIQGFLQTLKKPYIGPDYKTCALSMNKVWTKAVLQRAGVPVARYITLNENEWKKDKEAHALTIATKIKFPLVVKPVTLGSSIGVSFVKTQEELVDAIEAVFELDEAVLIEKRIFGRDFEISVLEGEKLICPRPGEIPTAFGLNDFKAKYQPKHALVKQPQADLPMKHIQKCQAMAKKIYRAIGGKGFIRIDFFIDRAGQVICNEVNPIPGCTPKSLFPRMLEAHGLKPEEIIEKMIINGLYHHRLDLKKTLKSNLIMDNYVAG